MAALTLENKYNTTALPVTRAETSHRVGSVSPRRRRLKCDVASTIDEEICALEFIVQCSRSHPLVALLALALDGSSR